MPDLEAARAALAEVLALKALARDDAEPQVAEKRKSEKKFARDLEAFFNKQNAAIAEIVRLHAPLKSFLSDMLDSAFDDQDAELREIIRKHLLQMAHDGQRGAIDDLGKRLGLGVDWAITSAQAEEWARKYSAELVKGISQSSRTRINQAVATYIDTPGADLQSVIDSIQNRDISEYRSSVIAITETTRAYSVGATQAWGEMGIEKMVWQTNNDEVVCPICRPLNQKVRKVGMAFGLDSDGMDILQPPAHPNCRCWLSPVVD